MIKLSCVANMPDRLAWDTSRPSQAWPSVGSPPCRMPRPTRLRDCACRHARKGHGRGVHSKQGDALQNTWQEVAIR